MAAALAGFTAAIARAPAAATHEERVAVARAHEAIATERAHPGHDAHGLGVELVFDEVRGSLRSLKNHKVAGCDGIPAELLKHSGGTRVLVVMHLFHAALATQCVPSTWRQEVGVHLTKGVDTGDCSHCRSRPLTLLPGVNKLFAKLISERIGRAMCLPA